jgi:hypothetical protein
MALGHKQAYGQIKSPLDRNHCWLWRNKGKGHYKNILEKTTANNQMEMAMGMGIFPFHWVQLWQKGKWIWHS